MLFFRRREIAGRKELIPLIMKQCRENLGYCDDAFADLAQELGRSPKQEDLTEELRKDWRIVYCGLVVNATVRELSNIIPDFEKRFLKVSAAPEKNGFDFFAQDFRAGIPAGLLYIYCYYILTGKHMPYYSARPLSMRQAEMIEERISELLKRQGELPQGEK